MIRSCPDEGNWSDFAAGRVSLERVELLAAHLDDCESCQATLRLHGADFDTLVSRLQKHPAPGPYDDEPQLRHALEQVETSVAPLTAANHGAQTAVDVQPGAPAASQRFGAYELLEPLGSGGMGVVYRALQPHLDRCVALKILPKERLRNPGAVARFQREMKAVGKLDHPNIVRAYDAGEVDGKHFLAMELVDGLDLSHLATRFGALPLADACELVRQAAEGLEHARSHGLVHRDIKPSNLMLSAKGQVKILDLGLAMLAEESAANDELTAAGQLMGTLDYLAPEQAEDSRAVDIRADIYSLGCTLYRLLAGEAPFSGPKFNTPLKKILAHARSRPEPIRESRPEAPEALAAVLERMMAKAPDDRFATPAEAAAALEPFTAGSNLPTLLASCRSIPAKPISSDAPTTTSAFRPSVSGGTQPDAVHPTNSLVGESTSPPLRWNRRYVIAAAGAAALAVLCGVIVVIKDRHGNKLVEMEVPEAGSVTIKSTADEPASSPQAASQISEVGNAADAPKPADKIEPARALETDSLAPGGVASRPEPIAGLKGWNLVSREPLVPDGAAAFHPRHAQLAAGGMDGVIRIRDSRSLAIQRVLTTNASPVMDLQWSPDGTLLAVRNEQAISVWQFPAGKELYGIDVPNARIERMAFSPRGESLATIDTGAPHALRVWRTGDGIQECVIPLSAVGNDLDWSPDGQRIATFGSEKTIRIWDIERDQLEKTIAVDDASGESRAVAWNALHGHIAYWAGGPKIRIIDGQTNELIREFGSFDGYVEDMAWSRDGKLLASSHHYRPYDCGVRLWAVATHDLRNQFKTPAAASKLHWSNDNERIAACGSFNEAGWVSVFDLQRNEPSLDPPPYEWQEACSNVAWHGGQPRIAAFAVGRAIQIWNLEAPQLLGELQGLAETPCVAAWSPDERLLASVGVNGTLCLWDVAAQQLNETIQLPKPKARPWAWLSWSADGGTLAAATNGSGAAARLFDARTPPLQPRAFAGMQLNGLAVLSPDAKLLACGAADNKSVAIRNVESGVVGRLVPCTELVSLSWSPDAKRFCMTDGPHVSVHDAVNESSPVRLHRLHSSWMEATAWSPDGKQIAGGNARWTVHLWDSTTGRLHYDLWGHAAMVRHVSWSSDSRLLASASHDGTIRFWDAKYGLPLGMFLRRGEKLLAIGMNGHVSGADENQFLYVSLTDAGQASFTQAEFAAKYGWKNDPGRVRLIDFEELSSDPAKNQTQKATAPPSGKPGLGD